ncbi:hypothetical protein I2I05_20480 [Hymenobacter sp. BT683]|uniref:PRTRC system protein E n=1 Tax=Hymenobacter jeongseonensis TaxID=2791027 RepID=A0ABS0IN59_9BACT|nr:hypothetical protein [Hymenobacter jeongseonensis]MBF9239782.1 hypothetical protein [Hymenobacter jeongseonensis]
MRLPMPYKNDPRRTLTLNLLPDAYDAVAAQAAAAGYATPGPYAKARVLGTAAAPVAADPAEAEAAAVRARQQAAQLAASNARATKWKARAEQAERALAQATQALTAARQAQAQAEQELAQAPDAFFAKYRPHLEAMFARR